MIHQATPSTIDFSVLEVLAQYDKAWLPPRIVEICEPMETLGLIERDGEQWKLTTAGRAMIAPDHGTRH